MKKTVLFSLITTTFIFANESNTTNNMPNEVKEGIKYIKMLGKELKINMKKHMKNDKSGVEAAEFCSTQASVIKEEVSKKFPDGVRVYRTSIKYRNPNNKPDEIDIKVLNDIQKKFNNKESIKKPIMVEANNKVRVYKPLIIEQACLKCHGDTNKINPKVKDIISKKYTNDKALNYKVGDLRGAIVAELPKSK